MGGSERSRGRRGTLRSLQLQELPQIHSAAWKPKRFTAQKAGRWLVRDQKPRNFHPYGSLLETERVRATGSRARVRRRSPKPRTNKGDSYPSSQRGPGGNPSAQIPQHAYDDDARLQPVRPGLEEEPEAEIQQEPPTCGVADINFGSATLARVNSIPRGHFTTGVYGGDITLSTKQQGGSYSLTKLPFQRLICLSASLAAVPATGAKFSTSNVNVF